MKTKTVVFVVIVALLLVSGLGSAQTLENTVYLPFVSNNYTADTITITSVPACNTNQDLYGTVSGVNYMSHGVAVYIMVEGGWWTKPYFTQPVTIINQDNTTWQTDVTTGGNDALATQFAAFLIPTGYAPPIMSGGATLPAELYDNSVAHTIEARDCQMRQIEFSGHTWSVKAGEYPMGPGPNYFSDDPENVFVDDQGHLHLKITYRDGKWQCAEVILNESYGYGRYTFHLASPVDDLDMNAVAGLFTWCDASPENNYCEIDIEFSRWSDPTKDIGQYVVQPYTVPGNMHRFDWTPPQIASTHMFVWAADSIFFQSMGGTETEVWNYTGDSIPVPANENVRLNLWLFNGVAPSDGNEVEVIFDYVFYTPD